MLGLYLASPLDRDTYLLAKATAVGLVLSLVTLGPPLFMLIARTVAGVGPDGFSAFVGVLWRGPRRRRHRGRAARGAVAGHRQHHHPAGRGSAAFILVTIGSAVIAETLVNAGASPSLFVLNLPYLPLELVGRLYGEAPGFISTTATDTSTATMAIAYVVITLGCAVFVRFRYQSIRVSR